MSNFHFFFPPSFPFRRISFIENGRAPNLSHNPIEKKFLTNGHGSLRISVSRALVTIRTREGKGNWRGKIVERYLKIPLDKVTLFKRFLARGKRSIEITEKCQK